jgi:hypothetical protein
MHYYIAFFPISALGGDGVIISDIDDEADIPVDFTDVEWARCSGMFCVLAHTDGSLETWPDHFDVIDGVDATGMKDISCGGACALVLADGTVITFGHSLLGGDSSGVDLTNVCSVDCGSGACGALKDDGTAVFWGYDYYGGDSTDIDLTSVSSISCGESSCMVRRADGSASIWPEAQFMNEGSITSAAAGVDLSNVCVISCGDSSSVCWTLYPDSTARVWGNEERGADTSNVDLTGVVTLNCGFYACAAYVDPNMVNDIGCEFYTDDDCDDADAGILTCDPRTQIWNSIVLKVLVLEDTVAVTVVVY